jgi:hypothetical protein
MRQDARLARLGEVFGKVKRAGQDFFQARSYRITPSVFTANGQTDLVYHPKPVRNRIGASRSLSIGNPASRHSSAQTVDFV